VIFLSAVSIIGIEHSFDHASTDAEGTGKTTARPGLPDGAWRYVEIIEVVLQDSRILTFSQRSCPGFFEGIECRKFSGGIVTRINFWTPQLLEAYGESDDDEEDDEDEDDG
jgi:hypothetical protein